MKEYIKILNKNGISILDVDFLIKNWKKDYCITRYNDRYRFIEFAKNHKGYVCKLEILKYQAVELIISLKLIKIKPSLFSNGATFFSKEYIDFKIKRLNKEKKKIEDKLFFINEILCNFEKSKSENMNVDITDFGLLSNMEYEEHFKCDGCGYYACDIDWDYDDETNQLVCPNCNFRISL